VNHRSEIAPARRGAWTAPAVLLLVALGAWGCATARIPVPGPALGGPRVADRSPATDRSEVGLASWYGEPHHGQPTASGEIFDMTRLTAAHRTLPLGTRLRVVNLENGRSVRVRVNDRGPYIAGRVLDLSREAARTLDMVERGVVPVKLEIMRE
jgi:rare lipoprotein A